MCAFSKDDCDSISHLAFFQCDPEMESVSLLPWIWMAGDSWLSRSNRVRPHYFQSQIRKGSICLAHSTMHTWGPLLHWGRQAGRERLATQRGHPKALRDTGRSSEHPRGQTYDQRKLQVVPAASCSVTPRCGVKCVEAKPTWPFQILDTNIVKLLLLHAESLPWSVMRQ